jgi:hypothetical protein
VVGRGVVALASILGEHHTLEIHALSSKLNIK